VGGGVGVGRKTKATVGEEDIRPPFRAASKYPGLIEGYLMLSCGNFPGQRRIS